MTGLSDSDWNRGSGQFGTGEWSLIMNNNVLFGVADTSHAPMHVVHLISSNLLKVTQKWVEIRAADFYSASQRGVIAF